MKGNFEITFDTWGAFACFTQSSAKVERVTYPVPTPSAIRGLISSIYNKPEEMYYQIKKIEVMKPIQYIDIKRNEIRSKIKNPDNIIYTSEDRTQRHSLILKNVYYRITSDVIVRDSTSERVTVGSVKKQILDRIEKGKCFRQPYFGMKEFMAFFSLPDESIKPIDESMDLGIMVYDVFIISNTEKLNTNKKQYNADKVVRRSFYHPNMINGVISVPEYESFEVYKGDIDVQRNI